MKFNNETYFDFDEEFDDPWTRVPNSILDDYTLSAKAVGIYTKIVRFQKSKKHKIYISSLTTQLKDGKSSVSSGINELIKAGYITRVQIRNEKGQMVGCKYVVHIVSKKDENYESSNGETIENTPSEPKPVFLTPGNPVSEKTSHKKKIDLKENKIKENKDVVDVDEKVNFELYLKEKETNEKLVKENMIIELYKTYKIQSKVMPQMKKLLLTYSDKIDLELYEEIFMLASEDHVKSKYKYIQDLLVKFDTKGIYTLEAYKLNCEEFKSSKKVNISQSNSKSNEGAKNGSKHKPFKTRFHGVCNTLENMGEDEVEETLAISQYKKFNNTQAINKVYRKAIEHGLNSLSTEEVRQSIINYAIFENLEIPK